MYRKVLIANRGEIAVRIVRACRKLGVTSVAVYSDADSEALHVRMADEAYHIGAAPPKESYLNIPKLVSMALDCGAEAIHPGYGFLSENPDFADAVREAGLVFIGPSADILRAMGDKVRSRRLATQAGLPVPPGSQGAVSPADATAVVQEIGYPVIVKGVGGGGGIGTAIVTRPDELAPALERAANVNHRVFGRSDVYVERYLHEASHVEVQLLADQHGAVLHLFDRDCSVQRRQQKVIEETPCPKLDAETRTAIHQAAVDFARSIGYSNAGTIELLLDQDGRFYFLEMNPRLQVEHRVTEVTTGIDIVEWQIRVAAGERLPYRQEELRQRGCSIEARVYAEDPETFIPSPGVVERFRLPPGIDLVVDTGVSEGNEVTPYYDPLLAKVVSWGESRREAIDRLKEALQRFDIGGVTTNIPTLLRVLDLRSFRSGAYTTGLLAGVTTVGALQEPDDFSVRIRAHGS